MRLTSDKRVVWGVIESCGLYTTFLFSAVVLYFLKTNALLFITGSMTKRTSLRTIVYDHGAIVQRP